MRVSAKVDYAVRAAVELAAAGGDLVKGEQLSQAQGIPLKFLENILIELRQAGIVRSQRGPEGGYWLGRSAAEISVADVIQAIDGPFTVTACSTENNECEQYSKCSIRDPLWQIRERIAAALGTVSVAELAADQIKGEGLRADAETVAAPVAIMRRANA